MNLFASPQYFNWTKNEDGMAIRFSNARRFKKAQVGTGDPEEQLGLIRMRMLAEEGQAEVSEIDSGIFIKADNAVRLDSETREGFSLPAPWPGGIRLKTESVPNLSDFVARLGLVNPGGDISWEWRLRGPILEVLGESYLPNPSQYAALRAHQSWNDLGNRNELSNLSMLASLREAMKSGCQIDLEAYQRMEIAHADSVSVDAREDFEGNLILRPVAEGDFLGVDAEAVEKRYAQAGVENKCMILRVGTTIVLLDDKKTEQFRALVQRGKVPKAQVADFSANPSGWLADHVFPDIEMEFSPRVTGIGFWKNVYAGSMWDESDEWFGKKPEPVKKPAAIDVQSGCVAESPMNVDDEPDDVKAVVALIKSNDSVLEYGGPNWSAPEMEGNESDLQFDSYARAPLNHQKEAVRWMMKHARRALNNRSRKDESSALGAGALFADDMGLGKTFSTLMFVREWFNLWRATIGGEPPAVLVVAPLSLLENWKSEITKSYGEENSVFKRVLIAQSEGELNKVRRKPGARDKAIPGEVQEYGLGFGDKSERSIDMPGSCVLTTYQTLRDYRFSFAKAEWSTLIFDEAQNIKNPNALQTIAAKSLKGLFRLTLTGTPVENQLGDFWSILDTSEPGPLGSFSDFRKNWISRMTSHPSEMDQIGRELREKIGPLMLRRMKEDELEGLPQKTGNTESIPLEMTAEQVTAYDSVIESLAGYGPEESSGSVAQNHQLAALWQIRQVSLHPDLLGDGVIKTSRNETEARSILTKSAKLKWLLSTLEAIRAKNEKALIFCVQKKLQLALAQHLGMIYGVSVPVINGDTKATSKSNAVDTRMGLIEQFSKKRGFGICVLSPIAAGAGLNIVAANHVIHLERHWNPAKEDQATDRAYRIGQEKPVHVYLPAAMHPSSDLKSFDEVLHGLINRKRGLQGALGLVPSQSVTGSELFGEVLASKNTASHAQSLSLVDAVGLSWHLFEALIALLYERQATRVILTPGGGDHGCDVVVLGWGNSKQNLLIQCKSTAHKELDSEHAVREIEGARPYYEHSMGLKFSERVLHTNAVRLSRRTLHSAAICNVVVHDRSWLAKILQVAPVSMSELLARDRFREKV